MTQSDPEQLLALQHQLQHILDDLGRTHRGRPVGEVADSLDQQITAAGLPDQPPSWVQSVSEQISTGDRTVLNHREAPADSDLQDPDPTQHAAG